MNKSSRHHYIPKFLIKNFVDDDGFLFVYNKQADKIISKKQSPKAIFFEDDRNTIDLNGYKSDNIENLYSEIDNKISIDLKNILQTKTISPEELTSIAILVYLLKWRVPKSDEVFNKIKEKLSQQDLAINIRAINNDSKNNEAAIKHIESTNLFKESKRILLGILPFINETTLLEIYKFSFINTNDFFPSLIGDTPFIEKQNSEIHQIEDFILPLSSTDTFIYKKGCEKKINSSLFYIQRDLAIIHSAEKYVGCKNKEHLEKLVAIYNQVKENNQEENIYKYVFNYIN